MTRTTLRALPLLPLLLSFTLPAVAQPESDSPYGDDEQDQAEDQTPQAGEGTITGTITDKQTGEALGGTTISVVGTEVRVVADEQGRYQLSLPPGKYALRILSPGYQPIRVQNLVVFARGTRKVDVGLNVEEATGDEFVVEAAPDSSSIDALALERKRSASMGDSVGRAEMSKTPDRNAAAAAQRVVGVNVIGNRFVYVRGLGERYTNALLNGAPLPSPEPDRAAVPLDLFPTLALESLTIVKTFTPDSPADFAGGSVRIETRRIPDKFLFQASLTGGYNNQSTFRERLDYNGSSTDWLGYDNGYRALPGDYPGYKLTPGANKPGGTTVNDSDLTPAGRDINSYFSTKRSFTPPDHSLSVVAGDGFKFGKDRKLGVLLALGYGRKFQIRTGEEVNTYSFDSNTNQLSADKTNRVDSGIETVNWGVFGSVGYDFSKDHHLTLLGFHSQIADDKTEVVKGFNTTRNGDIHDTRLTFVSRSLNFGQLHGEHVFPDADRATLDWAAWLSGASRNQPDTRNSAWQRSENSSTWTYLDDAFSGRHFWAKQSEQIVGGQINWTQPLMGDTSKLKLGVFGNKRKRDFRSRSLALRRAGGIPLSDLQRLNCPSQDFDACADSLFSGDNIGTLVELNENTNATDSYNADLNVYAAYLMADVAIFPSVRGIVGQRLEVTRQTIEPVDELNTGTRVEGASVDSTDLLPSVGLVFDLTSKAKLRTSLTRTIARPQLRELAPFAYTNYFGARPESGNQGLTLTHITNADLRFEVFPTLKEVLAFTVFYKHFTDPIETVIIASGNEGLVTYQNSKGADLRGVELEARKSFDFLSEELKHFTAIANLTVAVSRIELSGDQVRGHVTSPSRPMVNQAPYVLNLAMDYDGPTGTSFRILYNIAGAHIVQLGTVGLPDEYEHPRHVIDLTAAQELGKHFQLRATASNILNSEYLITQGKKEHDDNVVSRFTVGSLYTLSATYTY